MVGDGKRRLLESTKHYYRLDIKKENKQVSHCVIVPRSYHAYTLMMTTSSLLAYICSIECAALASSMAISWAH